MITINTVSATQFSFNGINYHKNFMPFVVGNKISIINVYDGCISLTGEPTMFSDYTVNGATFGSVGALQIALLDVIYTRNSLTPPISGAITGSLTSGYLPKATGSTTLGNSLIYDNGTNVGIGTTSPTSKLDITGTGDVVGTIRTNNVNGVAIFTTINDLGNTTEIGMWGSTRTAFGAIQPNNGYIYSGVDFLIGSNTFLKFSTGASNTERMRITSGGNVGIGTTSPSEKLTVNGNVKATSFIGSGESLTGLTSGQITTALGYTPYNATNPNGYVAGSGVSNLWTGTQAAYDAIATKSSTTIYFIQ